MMNMHKVLCALCCKWGSFRMYELIYYYLLLVFATMNIWSLRLLLYYRIFALGFSKSNVYRMKNEKHGKKTENCYSLVHYYFLNFFTFIFGKLENYFVKKDNNFAILWKIALKNRLKIIKSSQVVEIHLSVRLLCLQLVFDSFIIFDVQITYIYTCLCSANAFEFCSFIILTGKLLITNKL